MDLLTKAGFALLCKGSQQSGKVSRYRATTKLLQLRNLWRLRLLEDTHLARNTELSVPTSRALIVLHTGKIDLATGAPLTSSEQKQPVSFVKLIKPYVRRITGTGAPNPQEIDNWVQHLGDLEDVIEQINDSNASHEWRAYYVDEETSKKTYFEPNVKLRQIHVGKLFRATRLYSFGHLSGQNLSKAVRKGMTIDGERVAELDFSGYATRMLYHFGGTDPKGDVYRPELVLPKFYGFENASETKKRIARDFIKRATNICWNVSSRGKANSAVGRLLADAEYGEAQFVRKLIYNVEETTPKGIIERIMKAHPKLEHRFFTEIGIHLMTTDGRIMLHMLFEFTKTETPVLAIHDSIVCKASDVDFVRKVMRKTYFKFLVFKPVLNRVY